jgi:uncharacterized protein YcbK (DUF882 family)
MMDRRQFLKAGLVLAGAAAGSETLPFGFVSQVHAADASAATGVELVNGVRTLDLNRPDSHERLTLEYMRDGQWCGDAYNRICWLLRDVQAHRHVQMDTRLIAILDWTQRYLRQFGYTQPLHVLSGFRTQHTNQRTEGAAKNSQHLVGKAVDVRIPGLSAEYLGRLYRWLSQGGVGIYDSSNFVHVDTGPLRTPTGKLRNWRS